MRCAATAGECASRGMENPAFIGECIGGDWPSSSPRERVAAQMVIYQRNRNGDPRVGVGRSSFPRNRHPPSKSPNAGITEELRHLLSASPGIERFEVLGPAEHRPSLNFISLVEGALREPDFQPSLRELNLQSLHIPTSSVGRALQYLANLTSLTVSNVEPYHQELWKAFANRRIKLKELTVEEPTQPLVDYLGTYCGLQLFCLKHLVLGRRYVGKGYISDEIQRGILDEALPHHSESLVDIRFAYPPDHSDFEESWALGEDQILWFMQFPKLKAVTVSMWKGHRGVRFISLYHAFQGLFASLPPTVRLVRVVEHLWPATAGPKDLEKFEDLRLTGPIVDYHLKELRYLGFRWYLVCDPADGKYRFEMDEYGFLDSATDDELAMD
ncbi:hypothetical protein NMY22_g3104 [Coprinellus aureogranulatus]|nr:hypothetical protein NMY22_g3104 [Coprinellus aureogranulatus]